MAGGWTKMTRKSSYEVFSLTFWWLASFSVLHSIQKLCHFLRLIRFFLFIKRSSRVKDVCGICSGKGWYVSRQLYTRLIFWNYECVVCSLITQKKRLIQNLVYLKSPPSVTGFYQYTLFFTCLSASIYYMCLSEFIVAGQVSLIPRSKVSFWTHTIISISDIKRPRHYRWFQTKVYIKIISFFALKRT